MLIRRADPAPAFRRLRLGAVAVVPAVDEQVDLIEQRRRVGARSNFVDRVAAEHHAGEPARLRESHEFSRFGRLLERLAAEQRDALDRRGDLRRELGRRHRVAATFVEHLGIAAARASDRATLEPHREAVTRSLSLGCGDDRRDAEHARA